MQRPSGHAPRLFRLRAEGGAYLPVAFVASIVSLASCREETCDEDPVLELRDGSACFDEPRRYAVPASAGKLHAADLEGDGDIDFVFGGALEPGGSGTEALRVFRNTDARELVDATVDLAGSTQEVAVGDLDGDGDLDIAARAGGGEIVLLANDGASAFTMVNTLAANARAMVLSDLDGDGDAELVTISKDDILSLTSGALDPAAVLGVIGPVSAEDACLFSGEVTDDNQRDVFTERSLFPAVGAALGMAEMLSLSTDGCGVVFDLDGDEIDDVVLCDDARLGPLTADTSATPLVGVPTLDPEVDASPCVTTAVARGTDLTPTLAVFSDNRPEPDDVVSPLCRTITSVLPDTDADEALGEVLLGVFEIGGRSETWSPDADLLDIDGDGAVDLIEPSRGVVEVSFGRACE